MRRVSTADYGDGDVMHRVSTFIKKKPTQLRKSRRFLPLYRTFYNTFIL